MPPSMHPGPPTSPPPTSRPRALYVAVLLLLLNATLACAIPGRQPPSPAHHGVPTSRLARLARCVDITRWFWAVSDTTPPEAVPAHFAMYLGDADLDLIHQLGFRCVRLSIEPNLLYHKATPQVPDADTLAFVDAAVKHLLGHDLAVIVDLHDDHPDKPFEHDPDYASGYVVFWQTLARHFSDWNPEMVFLEALNEPVYKDHPRQWAPIQQRLLAAMRRGAPRLTLIATGPLWSSIDGLLMLKPVADANVIYSFHFYEPAVFTHQGAPWWVEGLDRYMADLPYPSASARCPRAVGSFTNVDVRTSALTYCAGKWNTAKLDGLIARAAHWSRAHGVPIIAGEFGVYCQHAPRADRLHWFTDVRAALQRAGIGWTLWGYDDCYGLGRQVDAQGQISIDWGVVQALGLDATARGRTSATTPP
jgi:endoglucanase